MRAKILNASAGSGKTYQLAYKYVRDTVEQPALYRHILAVTFTNKATEEMKSRILKEIDALASGAPCGYRDDLCRELGLDAAAVRTRAREVRTKILHDYSHFTVLTIDTFFQRILRAFIKELGIDLDYNIEIETAPMLTKGADTLVEEIATDRDLRRWMTEFVQERIDEGRRWDVRDGILTLGAELFKEKNKQALSAARSREELRGIVARMGGEAARTREELRQTAAEAVALIAGAGLTAADFPYKASGFAAWFYAAASGSVERYGARVEAACTDDARWGRAGTPSQALRPQLQPLLRRMCAIHDANVRRWNTCELLRENYRSFALLADLYARVRKLCDEQNVMLLSETKYLLAEFIGHNDAPFIYEKVGNRFERFMIDEFQDTSLREWENFLPLLQNAMAQSEAASVLLVGDIKQSIYRWRGGDWRLLHSGARRALGEGDTEVADLQENFRSLPAVVEFNNRLIARVVEADNLSLNALVDEAAARGDLEPATAAALRDTLADAYRGHEQLPRRRGEHPGYVSVETFAERPPVVERICALIDKGFRPGDIMILVRGATDGAKVAAELLAFKRRNTDPRYRFDVVTQEALVVGNAPVSSFVAAALRLALDDSASLDRALYNRYLGRAFDVPLAEEERAFFRSIRLLSPEEAFERIVMRHDLALDRLQTAYLQAVHEQIIAFCANRIADIPLWLRWWDEVGCQRSLSVQPSENAVEITTIHKAKGLEKSAVVIPYCVWQLDPKAGGVTNIVWAEARGEGAEAGRVPVRYRQSMGESDFSEEFFREKVFSHVDNVNLLYVALTRAAESLHIFVPQRGGKNVGSLLLQSLSPDGERALLGDLEGRYSATEAGERFEFGEFTGPVPAGRKAADAEHVVLEHYTSSQADLRLRLPAQRYFDEDETALSPRNFGVLMHLAFENADDEEDIRRAVERMRADGLLSAADAGTLRQMIDRALADPTVRAWFSGGWQRIRNEHEIIVPAGGAKGSAEPYSTGGDSAVQASAVKEMAAGRSPVENSAPESPDATEPGAGVPPPSGLSGSEDAAALKHPANGSPIPENRSSARGTADDAPLFGENAGTEKAAAQELAADGFTVSESLFAEDSPAPNHPTAPADSPAIPDNSTAPAGSPAVPVNSPTAPAGSPAVPVNSPSAPAGSPAVPINSPTAPAGSPAVPINSPTAPADTPAVLVNSPTAPAGSPATRRPDRVMTDGKRAVVVDYKFGMKEPDRYRRQIRTYCDLLRQMGYTEIEGYLWYVRLGTVERVV